jgi:hypothetical protein
MEELGFRPTPSTWYPRLGEHSGSPSSGGASPEAQGHSVLLVPMGSRDENRSAHTVSRPVEK